VHLSDGNADGRDRNHQRQLGRAQERPLQALAGREIFALQE
jgi:hypothetical protein